MIKLLFDIVGDISLMLVPAYFVYIIIRLAFDVLKNKNWTYGKSLKFLLCLELTVGVVVSSLMMMSFAILYAATTFKEVEDLPVWFNSAVFANIQFFVSIVAVVVLHNVWKNIYYRQILSDKIKKRIKDLFKRRKKDEL